MALFLKIALGSVLLLLVIAIALWWWFKRWLGKKIGSFVVASELADPRYARPARLQLQAATQPESNAALNALWAQFHGLGFEVLADLVDGNGAFELMRVARHTHLPIALTLTQTQGEEGIAEFAVFSLSDGNQLRAVSNGPQPSTRTPSMHWEVDTQLDPRSALQQLQQVTADLQLRTLDLRVIKAIYERAYATRIDAELAQAPTRAAIEQRAMLRTPPADSAQIDQALELSLGQWFEQISRAAIDQYQRESSIDAVRWESIKDQVEVIHDKLRPQDIKNKLDGDVIVGQLVDQFAAQGYQGIVLYKKVVERLPAARQRERLGEVARPLRALLFVASGDQEARVDAAGTHLYSAVDAEGAAVHGTVLASNSSDAQRQLAAMGLNERRILSEPVGSIDMSSVLLDPAAAATAVKANLEPLYRSVLRAIFANVWLWGPPLALVVWSVHGGTPYGWGDFLGFGYAALALAVLFCFIAPMVIYNQLLRARVLGRWSTAQACLSVLQWMWMPGVGKSYLLSERCKILAARGKLPEALALWQRCEASETPETYLAALASIYDAAGASDDMIATQRRMLVLNPNKEMYAIDLAMSLARHQGASDEAEDLISRVPLGGLSELVMLGYQFTRGMIAAERGQHTQAIRHYGEALKQSQQFQGNPLMLGVTAEINGFVALSMKRMGDIERADALWNTLLPLLKMHSSAQNLIRRYTADEATP